MARARSRTSKPDTESAPVEAEEKADAAPESPSDAPETPAEAEETSEAPKPPQKPRGREFLAQEYVRGKGPLGEAFLAERRLKFKRSIKHTREEWDALWQEFMTRKR